MKALVFSLFSAVLSGCVSHTNAPDRTYPLPDHEWRVTRDVVFTPADWPKPLKADIYTPFSKGPHPTVMTVHGGGLRQRLPGDAYFGQGAAVFCLPRYSRHAGADQSGADHAAIILGNHYRG